MNVRVHPERCIGSGMCVLTAPTVFDQDPDDAVVTLLDPHPAADRQEAVREAARRCPAEVIDVSDG